MIKAKDAAKISKNHNEKIRHLKDLEKRIVDYSKLGFTNGIFLIWGGILKHHDFSDYGYTYFILKDEIFREEVYENFKNQYYVLEIYW